MLSERKRGRQSKESRNRCPMAFYLWQYCCLQAWLTLSTQWQKENSNGKRCHKCFRAKGDIFCAFWYSSARHTYCASSQINMSFRSFSRMSPHVWWMRSLPFALSMDWSFTTHVRICFLTSLRSQSLCTSTIDHSKKIITLIKLTSSTITF